MEKTKSSFKTLICILIAAMMLVSAVLCGCTVKGGNDNAGAPTSDPESTAINGDGDETPAPTAEPEETVTEVPEGFYVSHTYSFVDDAGLFKIAGRSAVSGKGITCDWSAGGFEINAVCRGEISVKLTLSGSSFFTVFVDGVRLSEDIQVKANTVLAKDLPAGFHHIEVYRQNEVRQGMILLKSLTLEGELTEPPAQKSRYLVFIGDSISSGFGVHLKDTAPGTEDHTDATMAYPFLTARELDADFDVISVIGIGLVKGYVNETMGEILGLTNYYRSRKATYSTQRVPDAVIVNLGTNDATHSSDPEKFKAAVRAITEQILEIYGKDVPIVWVYNSMRADHHKYTLEVIEALAAEGVNISGLKFKADASAYGHPSGAAHQKDTEVLKEYLLEQKIIVAST